MSIIRDWDGHSTIKDYPQKTILRLSFSYNMGRYLVENREIETRFNSKNFSPKIPKYTTPIIL